MTTASPKIPTAVDERTVYQPRGAARDLFRCKESEILLEGPAGTGKTRAILEKVFLCAMKYAGMRALIGRKTRASMTTSVLVTFETKVIPSGSKVLLGPERKNRQSYLLPNGSEIVVGGMDNADRTLSTEYDLIAMFEATELSEHDWEMLQRAKRNGRMPYQQAVADCNPAGRNHWLNRRAKTDQMTRLLSRHEDNPIFFNADGTMTDRGVQYIDGVLEKLSGARYQRLRLGKWAEAQGTVYPDFDPVVHWVDPFPIPQDWRRIRSIDFGFENAFVCQWWAMDHDDRMYMYREIYMSRRIVEDHAKQIKALSEDDAATEATVADHDAEDRATLARHNIGTIAARKSIRPGIDAVTSRLKKSQDGRPRLFIFRDATVETDTRLVNEKRPTSTADEFEAYIWPTHKETANARNKKETPLDRDNHGMDAMRYAVAYVDSIGDGTMPLDVIATGADDDIVDDILSRGIDLTDEALWSDV